MSQNISNEIAADGASKTQIRAFVQSTRFIAHLDETGIVLSLKHRGPDGQHKSDDMHFHYVLFADILRDLAHTAWAQPPNDVAYREALRDSARTLYVALESNPTKVLKLMPQRSRGDGRSMGADV